MTELKPCPFCGSGAELIYNVKRRVYGSDRYVEGTLACCKECDVAMFRTSTRIAIEAWNRRVKDDNTGND